MNLTILGENQYVYGDMVRKKIIACIVVVILAATSNTVVMWLHTRESLFMCIIMNALLDVVAGWFVIWQLDRFILPGRKLLRLYKKAGIIVNGEVEEISKCTERYYGFDCWVVTVGGHKLFLVDNGTISLKVGQPVSLETVHGVVKEVLL